MTSSFARASVWALLIVLAAVAGFLAYSLVGRSHRAETFVDTAAPKVAPSLPKDEAAQPTARPVPQALPDFTLTDSHGQPRTLAHWKDRPLIVNFWATWCEPCRREIPLLKKLRQDYAAQGIEVVGIAVDFREAVLKYAQDMGIDYPMLIGEQDALEAIDAFGMEPVFPFTVFSDRRAQIVAIKVGELHADEAALILGQVKAIDSGQTGLPDAKLRIADGLRALAAGRARQKAASNPVDTG